MKENVKEGTYYRNPRVSKKLLLAFAAPTTSVYLYFFLRSTSPLGPSKVFLVAASALIGVVISTFGICGWTLITGQVITQRSPYFFFPTPTWFLRWSRRVFGLFALVAYVLGTLAPFLILHDMSYRGLHLPPYVGEWQAF